MAIKPVAKVREVAFTSLLLHKVTHLVRDAVREINENRIALSARLCCDVYLDVY